MKSPFINDPNGRVGVGVDALAKLNEADREVKVGVKTDSSESCLKAGRIGVGATISCGALVSVCSALSSADTGDSGSGSSKPPVDVISVA